MTEPFTSPPQTATLVACALIGLLPSLTLAQEAAAPPTGSTKTPVNSAPAASSSTPTSAAGAGSTTGVAGENAAPNAVEAPSETPAPTTVSVGIDAYSGASNLQGQHRFSDGFWASGASLAYPSAAYARLQKPDGTAAKFSIGTGDLYRGSSRTVKQPIELWIQKPLQKLTVTGGKYYVPFALQEWQYETKYGVQLQRAFGASDLTASLNYNRDTNRPNLYFRAGRNFSETLNAGISLASGAGLSYGSIHNRGIALDTSLQARNFKLYGEVLALQRRASDRFTFAYTKLVYDKYARVKPFVAYYKWNDRSDTFGDFRSIAYGATVEVKPGVLIEGGGAATADKNILWLQLHLLLERDVYRAKSPALTTLPGMTRPPFANP